MPEIRSFRALRFDPGAVGDLARVVSPPYDVISEELRRTLLERHPANVVRLDLPGGEPGDGPNERYERASRTLTAWRTDGILRRDAHPALYAYEQVYRIPGSRTERRQRGFFGRLRIEPPGTAGGILPHERTIAGPREDRYNLLRATAVNTSPVVTLYEDRTGRAATIADELTAGSPDLDVVDDDDVRHRLWVVADHGAPSGLPAELLGIASAGPITIADGHHRYETALRYRDELAAERPDGTEQPWDYILALFLESGSQALTVLPTHRIVHGLGGDGVAAIGQRAADMFAVRPASSGELSEAFSPIGRSGARHAPAGDMGTGEFGLWTRHGGFILDARRDALDRYLPAGSGAVRELDVTLLGVALERIAGIDAAAVGRGDRVSYLHDAGAAMARVDAATDRADAAFLVHPTPVAAVVAVASEGDVMPQKSTYFYPKALTGLVINPHEW